MIHNKLKNEIISLISTEDDYKKMHKIYFQIIIFVLLYIVSIYIQSKAQYINKMNLNGVIAQFQVMISVYVVMNFKKLGYILALIMNIIASSFIAFQFFMKKSFVSFPGIVVPLCTVLIISIIYLCANHLNEQIVEITKQKEKLEYLNEEIASAHKELERQNKRLYEYNTVMKENEEKLSQLAFYDVLTGLPNRKMVINRIDFLVDYAEKRNIEFGVVFIDLDNFKKINDTMGHHAGDILLQTVTSKLKKAIYKEDMLGRLGGDEFALVIQSNLKDYELEAYIENLRVILMDKFIIENSEFHISASFGIAFYPNDGADSAELLKCADMAMYRAKDSGKNEIRYFGKIS